MMFQRAEPKYTFCQLSPFNVTNRNEVAGFVGCQGYVYRNESNGFVGCQIYVSVLLSHIISP